MSGPIHLNQVIFQTPNVEKIQQTELQNPDMTQRHAAVEEQIKHRQKTETVQTSVEPEQTRYVENEERKREKGRKRKKPFEAPPEEPADKKVTSSPDSGLIVDVII